LGFVLSGFRWRCSCWSLEFCRGWCSEFCTNGSNRIFNSRFSLMNLCTSVCFASNLCVASNLTCEHAYVMSLCGGQCFWLKVFLKMSSMRLRLIVLSYLAAFFLALQWPVVLVGAAVSTDALLRMPPKKSGQLHQLPSHYCPVCVREYQAGTNNNPTRRSDRKDRLCTSHPPRSTRLDAVLPERLVKLPQHDYHNSVGHLPLTAPRVCAKTGQAITATPHDAAIVQIACALRTLHTVPG